MLGPARGQLEGRVARVQLGELVQCLLSLLLWLFSQPLLLDGCLTLMVVTLVALLVLALVLMLGVLWRRWPESRLTETPAVDTRFCFCQVWPRSRLDFVIPKNKADLKAKPFKKKFPQSLLAILYVIVFTCNK